MRYSFYTTMYLTAGVLMGFGFAKTSHEDTGWVFLGILGVALVVVAAICEYQNEGGGNKNV